MRADEEMYFPYLRGRQYELLALRTANSKRIIGTISFFKFFM